MGCDFNNINPDNHENKKSLFLGYAAANRFNLNLDFLRVWQI